ncbi:hypothetical protein PRZ48_003566 [Zasmidium cellare]|uniref:Uncharacterized protein n=1 Tax=Zasmidium cellare TaxID=395010 RepID=A0ABR0EWZ2_ZASCE|nr:hypothetical protein PRZ48_003566 [Zasmidium cellare]
MASAFTSLAAPAVEDSMEVSSSPAPGDIFDTDIDIDYGDYSGAAHLTDDERMLEDGDPTRPATATDEMMDDEDHTTTLVEEVMQDDIPLDQNAQPDLDDEELIDYDDDDYPDLDQSFYNDTTLQNTEIGLNVPEPVPEATSHDEAVKQPELFTEEHTGSREPNAPLGESVDTTAAEVLAPEVLSSETQANSNVNTEHAASTFQPKESTVAAEALEPVDEAGPGDELHDEDEAVALEPEQLDSTTSLKARPHLPGTLDTTAHEVPDGPPTPTDTGLHPMTVNFRDYSMPMFKSSKQLDGLLKNDNLASIGLSNLMQDCRKRLQIKLGEGISEDDDIVLVFDRLDLILIEGNSSTFDTSLNEIIDVWQQLHYNDGVQDVPPLTVTLSSQPKFSTSVAKLQKAVNDGQGISSIPDPYAGEDEEHQDVDHEAEPTEEYTIEEGQDFAAGEEEQYEGNEGLQGHEYPEEHEPYQEHEGTELREGYEGTQENYEEHQAHEYPEEGHLDPVNYEEVNENEEYPNPEDFDHYEEAETTAETFDAPEDQNQDEASEEKSEVVKPDSAASSTTVRGDTANDAAGEYKQDLIAYDDDLIEYDSKVDANHDHTATGEYDEDLIDWNDDLIEYDSEPDANHDGANDSSAPLTEQSASAGETEVGHAQNLSNGSEQVPDSAASAKKASDPQSSAVDEKEQAALLHESEELLSYDDDEQPQGEETAAVSNVEQQQDNPDDGLIEYEEENFDEADLIDYDDQDDEQFHTALDLLDGDHTEHGPDESNTTEPSNQPQGPVVDEDDIGYDDEDPVPETTANGSTNSPHGKRSFEDLADDDELTFDDEPEPKKARSD